MSLANTRPVDVEPFDMRLHAGLIRSWCEARCLPWEPGLYPISGRVADHCLAAFVYHTDSAVAFIDNMIGDPAASPRRVQRAFYAMALLLIDDARQMGAKVVTCPSASPGVASALRRLGFSPYAPTQYFAHRIER